MSKFALKNIWLSLNYDSYACKKPILENIMILTLNKCSLLSLMSCVVVSKPTTVTIARNVSLAEL